MVLGHRTAIIFLNDANYESFERFLARAVKFDYFVRRPSQNAMWSGLCTYTLSIKFNRNNLGQGLFRSSLFSKIDLFHILLGSLISRHQFHNKPNLFSRKINKIFLKRLNTPCANKVLHLLQESSSTRKTLSGDTLLALLCKVMIFLWPTTI